MVEALDERFTCIPTPYAMTAWLMNAMGLERLGSALATRGMPASCEGFLFQISCLLLPYLGAIDVPFASGSDIERAKVSSGDSDLQV